MNIPCKINPLGVVSLPASYLPALFLESTENSVTMKTGIAPTVNTGVYGNIIASQRWCESYSVSRWIPPYAPQGGYVYDGSLFQYLGASLTGEYEARLNWLNDRIVAARNVSAASWTSHTKATAPTASTADASLFIYVSKIKRVRFSEGSEITHDFQPAIDAEGVPCMVNVVTNAAHYKASASAPQYIVGMTAAQARQLGKLPADSPTKKLTVSLPQSAFVDVETGEIADAAVNAALAQAEAKGWIITKQYYTE